MYELDQRIAEQLTEVSLNSSIQVRCGNSNAFMVTASTMIPLMQMFEMGGVYICATRGAVEIIEAPLSTINELTVKTRVPLEIIEPQDGGFLENIKSAIQEVSDTQKQSAELTKNFELGLENDLTKVMIQQQLSSLGFQMTLNVRNKVLSAYKDIMNMPV